MKHNGIEQDERDDRYRAYYRTGKDEKELFNLRFQHVTGQLENPVKMREVKRNIARVKTIIREKELEKVQA